MKTDGHLLTAVIRVAVELFVAAGNKYTLQYDMEPRRNGRSEDSAGGKQSVKHRLCIGGHIVMAMVRRILADAMSVPFASSMVLLSQTASKESKTEIS